MTSATRSTRRAATILVLAVLAFAVAAPSLQATPQPHPDPDVRERLRAADTPAGDALLVAADVTLGTARPATVSVPVTALAAGARGVTLQEIRVSSADGRVRTVVRPGAFVRPNQDRARLGRTEARRTDILDRLADRDHRISAQALGGGYVARVDVPVADLALTDGTAATFTVAADFADGARTSTVLIPFLVTVAALPTAAGWSAGDGHVHSSDWSDGWNSLATQVGDAKAAGQKWIIVTDHWKGIRAVSGRGDANWALYRADCATKEITFQMPVLPGVEIMTSQDQGHALAHSLAGSKLPPTDQALTPASLLGAIATHSPSSSFAVVAHPYSATPWSDWVARPIGGLELMSQERQASASTQARWFALLRVGLAKRIAGGGFTVGVAGTDAHAPWQRPGEAGITWIRSAATPLTRDAVWNAIRTGAVSASGRGDLGYFTVNGVQQGGVAVATPGNRLEFAITQKPVTGRRCTEISIRNSANAVVWSVRNPAAATCAASLPTPSADTFYVVKMNFSNAMGLDASDVWCNPVFIDRR